MAFMGTAEAEATVTMEPVVAMKKTTAVEAIDDAGGIEDGKAMLEQCGDELKGIVANMSEEETKQALELINEYCKDIYKPVKIFTNRLTIHALL